LPGDRVSFSFRYRCPNTKIVMFEALNLGAMPAGHREHFVALDCAGKILTEKVLRVEDPAVQVLRASPSEKNTARPGLLTTSTQFFVLGVEHIWTGYDHLLFLFGMLVVCGSLRSILAIVSSFTIAHSVTLGMATLGWIVLPAKWVEPLIAISIVFVGVENLLRNGGEPRGRWIVTLAFGLIHGFGFANVLRDLGIGRNGQALMVPLFSFNLGVELGQLAVAAAVLPLLLCLRRWPQGARLTPLVLSTFVVLMGGWWLLERTVFL